MTQMEHGVVRSLFNILPTRRLRRLARSRLGLDIRHAHSREFDFVPYEMNTKYTRRLFHFERLLEQIGSVDGRIVECGVGPGRSIFAFAVISESLGRTREIWGYDTFEGMPPPQEQDGSENANKGGWWSYSREHVRELLRLSGLDESFIRDRITFVPGDLRDTLPRYDGAPIALLHLDVDFYASYKCALEFLYPHVSEGGIVAFDEYGSATWIGATRAIDEFFADRPERVVKSPVVDLYYVVKESD